MLSHPAILVLLLGLAAVVLLSLLRAWRDRSVDFIHRRAFGPQTDGVAALMLDRVVPVLVRDG
jgi:hypothetical protein